MKSQIIDVIKEFEASEQKNRPYAVYFTDTNEDFSVLTRDTNVYVSFLKMNPLIKNVNYKGVLSIDSLTIAIFDKNGVGAKYYDSTKLTYISLEHLHRVSEEEGRYFGVLEVMNDSLIRWEGP